MLQLFYFCVGLLGAILSVREFNTLTKEAFFFHSNKFIKIGQKKRPIFYINFLMILK